MQTDTPVREGSDDSGGDGGLAKEVRDIERGVLNHLGLYLQKHPDECTPEMMQAFLDLSHRVRSRGTEGTIFRMLEEVRAAVSVHDIQIQELKELAPKMQRHTLWNHGPKPEQS